MTDPPLEPMPGFAEGRMQVHLVGFMGVGKSTLGRLLARRRLWNFLDLDHLVVRHVGLSVPEIFARQGEAAFRAAEAHALRQASLKPRTVVALGGGAWVREGNREVSARHAVSLWLDCPLEEVRARLGEDAGERPLWSEPASVERLFEQRRELYATADARIDAAGAPEIVLARVVERLGAIDPGQ